jgi:hypothetical protein
MCDSMDAAPSQKSSIGVQSPRVYFSAGFGPTTPTRAGGLADASVVRHADPFSGVASWSRGVQISLSEQLSLSARERVPTFRLASRGRKLTHEVSATG